MTALIRSPDSPTGWWRFAETARGLLTHRLEQVPELLREVERALRSGMWAIGFVGYEAAPAFDTALRTHAPGRLPLAWFALCEPPRAASGPPARTVEAAGSFEATVPPAQSAAAVATIRERIAAGDTYQVNYTYRLRGHAPSDPEALFGSMIHAQGGSLSAYLETSGWIVLSASPELFFERRGGRLVSRPMKGTIERGRTPNEDRRHARSLATSEKDRAENLMILDMVRNDLGRIATPGGVRVTRRFQLEQYPTLWQMTSEVEAESRAGLGEIFTALFPAASITGAPKAASMQIIRELESTPREIYTGAIGWAAPDGAARFSVAIRTAWIDRDTGILEYGTGGGIVWDSRPESEQSEARSKAAVLLRPPPRFELLETLCWRPHSGYRFRRRHLDRLAGSAAHFGYPLDRRGAERALDAALSPSPSLPPRSHIVRLLLGCGGEIRTEAAPLPQARGPWRLAFARAPIDPRERLLYHKTTWRQPYDEALSGRPGYDDVLLWNPGGEVTESTRANLLARFGDEWLTPPVSSGLLAGVARSALLRRDRVRASPLPIERLRKADDILLVNSVRGAIRVQIDWPTAPRRIRDPHPAGT